MEGLIGKKLGMTQVFDGDGRRIAVTVIATGPCIVVQCKTTARDGYDAVQLGFGDQKESRLTKPARTRFARIGAGAKSVLREFAIDEGDNFKEGDALCVTDVFAGVSHVDVVGITKGRGFQGVVKRHGMLGGPKTHGGHSKRRVGSIGANSYPARVIKGQRMPGHMGHVRVTTQNLKVVGIRSEDNLLLVQGAIPGPNGGVVLVHKALKKRARV